MAAGDFFCKIFAISGITVRTCHSLVGSTVVDQRQPKTKGSALIVYQGPIRVFVKKIIYKEVGLLPTFHLWKLTLSDFIRTIQVYGT